MKIPENTSSTAQTATSQKQNLNKKIWATLSGCPFFSLLLGEGGPLAVDEAHIFLRKM